jgi:hypothetical protein
MCARETVGLLGGYEMIMNASVTEDAATVVCFTLCEILNSATVHGMSAKGHNFAGTNVYLPDYNFDRFFVITSDRNNTFYTTLKV